MMRHILNIISQIVINSLIYMNNWMFIIDKIFIYMNRDRTREGKTFPQNLFSKITNLLRDRRA